MRTLVGEQYRLGPVMIALAWRNNPNNLEVTARLSMPPNPKNKEFDVDEQRERGGRL